MKLARVTEYFAVLSVALLLVFYSQPVLSLTADTDKSIELSGKFSVAGGQASYSMPISVSPGRAAHQPSISLEYRSDSPNGLLGIGWSLGGLSSISRCGKNLSKDRRWGGVNFNYSDRYCLDGQRLVAIEQIHNANITEYRVENNGYAKIVSYGRAGNGPASFKVWHKDGSVYEYGMTEDSRAELPSESHVYKWALNKKTDASKSNHIDFIYREDNVLGKHTLEQVNYIGGKVNFVYEEREDSASQYLGGKLLSKTERLKQIRTFDSENNNIGNYNLTYELSDATSRSRLVKVNYCARGQCSSDIQFEWTGRNVVELQRAENTGLTNPRYININGSVTPYGEVSRNSNNTMSVKDLNGVVRPNIKSFSLSGSTDSPSIAFDTCPLNTARTFDSGNGQYGTYCQFDVCSGASCKYGSSGVNYGDFDGDGDEEWSRGYSSIDINGDGIDDLHKFDDPRGNYRYKIGSRWQTLPSAGGRVLKAFTDLNNDGYLDAVMGSATAAGNLYVHLFNGKSFNSPTVINHRVSHEDEIHFADLNNDGYPELGSGRYFYKNNRNNGFFTTVFLDAGAPIYSVQDVNGDGWNDVLTRTDGDNAKARIRYSIAQEQDKITAFLEVGIDYAVTYQAATSDEVYSRHVSSSGLVTAAPVDELGQGLTRYPFQIVTPRRYLVANVVKSPKGYRSTHYSYKYQGAKMHLRGGGFLGFKTITEIENAEVVTTTKTTFEQDRLEIAGKPLTVEVSKNGKKVAETSYQYKVNTSRGNINYYQVYADKVEKNTFGLASDVAERKETITRTLDRFGNLLEETSVLSSDIEGAGQFTNNKQYRYINTDISDEHHVYEISTPDNNLTNQLSSLQTGLKRYCTANDEVYFKTPDHIVFVSVGGIDTPLLIQRSNVYFKYQITRSYLKPSGVVTYLGELNSVSSETFDAAELRYCGEYNVFDFDEDGEVDLSSSAMTYAELIDRQASHYWKVGAIKEFALAATDHTSNLVRRIDNTYTYDHRGLLTTSTMSGSDYESTGSVDTDVKNVINRYRYDQWGNVVAQSIEGTDLPERRTTTQYDSQGLYETSSNNALGHRSRTHYNPQGQLLSSSSALKDRTHRFAYDAFGRVISETLPGTDNTNTTQYKLGSQCGQYATSQTVSCATAKSASGGEVTTYFDYAGREVRKLHTGFAGQLIVVDTRWDRNGRKLSVTRPQFVNLETPAPIVTFGYDALNREISKQEPADGNRLATFTTTYEGYKTTIKDARGYEHSTDTNILGHVLRKDEPHGAYQTYQYYPDGKLRASTDSAGNTTQIRYDNLGHRSYLDDPDMGQWSYNYNAAGELIYKRDAKGTVTTIGYDTLGRKVRQTEGGQVSTWRYDERGALGTLSGFVGNGSETDYYYNRAGLLEETAVNVNQEKFSTEYFYDQYERLAREVRPNGVDTQASGVAALLDNTNNDRLAVEYVYNPYGYVSAVRSPKNYADRVFSSASFRDDIRQLLNQAIAQATEYLTKAERYHNQKYFYDREARRNFRKKISMYTLDSASLAMLGEHYRYKRYCTSQNVCYLRPTRWIFIPGDVSLPLEVTLKDKIYRFTTTWLSEGSQSEDYRVTLEPVSVEEFELAEPSFTSFDELLLSDYDNNGQRYLVSSDEGTADVRTKIELSFTASDLSEAANIANTRYQYYSDLARDLLDLSEKVAELSGVYCEFANQLGGNQLQENQRVTCQNNQQTSQADHLNLILTQSQLEDSLDNPAYIYYWQRRETDAYDHTLSETLGNGLVNTYNHNANTGRPNAIATHKGSQLFDHRLQGNTTTGRNIRFIEYRYDAHNNVTSRYDQALDISDRWQYDGLDRVIGNSVSVSNRAQYGGASPEFSGSFTYRYDRTGNLTYKTDIGDYTYSNQQAGPHAVTKANGLNYQYDANGNMLRARADNSTENERELEWTEFNKPSKITRNGKSVEFYYDANHNRYLKKNSDGIETFYFGKTYERVTDTNTGIVQHKHFIYADGKLIALNTQTKEADNSLKDKQIRYLHYDALNSVDMITDGYGLVVERRSYDTWGKQRPVAWREEGPLDVVQAAITNRGYTGHEEIVEVGLVHMNGRVYDQELGRFISPDPIVQAPYITNSFNRYAYVWNNPLKFIDPTGYRLVEGAGVSEPGIRDGIGRYEPPRDNGKDDSNSNRNPGRDKGSDRDPERNPGTGGTENKPKEVEEPKVEPTVEPPSQKYQWGNEDLAGEMDPEVRNEALRDTMNSLTGVEDFVDAAETVLDANATIADKVVAVGGAFAKRTPLGKVVSKAVTKSTGRKLPFADKDRLTEINKTLDRIESNGPFPHKRDGITFKNREGKLPEGNYKEYTVDTPGASNRGARRVVKDQNTGNTYYTDDHYENFTQIDPKKY